MKDNTVNKTIDAVITTTPPRTLVWQGNLSGDWDTATANWIDAANLAPTTFTDGDFVIFDDSVTGATTVNVVGVVFPGQSPATPGTTISNSAVNYTFTGGTFSGTGRSQKLGTGLVTVSATHGTAFIVTGGALEVSGAGVLNGGFSFSGTGATNNGTINGPLFALAGVLVNNGTLSTAPGVVTTGAGAQIINAASGTINAGGGTWSVVTGATLWNYGLINNLLGRLNVTGTLAGPGIIADVDFGGPIDGRVTIQNGGTIAPGASIGSMEIQGRLDIEAGARAQIETDLDNSPTSDVITVDTMGSINGTFVMNNIGATPFALGQSFVLISGNFGVTLTNANVNHIPVLSPVVPGVGLQWDVSQMRITNALRTLRIASAPVTPPTMTNTFGGRTNLTMTWPTTHLGWQVIEQTNNLHLGISTNRLDWSGIVGSEQTNRITVPVTSTNAAGFYRLSNQ